MAEFSTIATVTPVAADTSLSVIASATARPGISEIIFGSSATPNDYSVHFQLQRFSADGTGTAVTPQPLDFNERPAIATSKHTYTVEPTNTANEILLNLGHNQRATPRWVAQPGREVWAPALAGDGLGLRCIAISTVFVVELTMFFTE